MEAETHALDRSEPGPNHAEVQVVVANFDSSARTVSLSLAEADGGEMVYEDRRTIESESGVRIVRAAFIDGDATFTAQLDDGESGTLAIDYDEEWRRYTIVVYLTPDGRLVTHVFDPHAPDRRRGPPSVES